MKQTVDLTPGDALLIADMQNDFLSCGALAVPDSERIIPILNRYIAKFRRHHLAIYATRNWHPIDHPSFDSQGGPWPAHCIAGSQGAEFSAALLLPKTVHIISKEIEKTIGGYSAFAATGLHRRFQHAGVKRLFIGGLTTDYGVLQTVLDALRFCFRVYLLLDAIRAVNVNPEDGPMAMCAMLMNGAEPLTVDRLS